ncbi:MAG: calcineurin-like phosphoesterase C-terminal domain-containing protein [Alistipes sp.]|nr:calcineurin-like phosphoesterase C-terminal domain-containing protein [Alistipes sp.]
MRKSIIYLLSAAAAIIFQQSFAAVAGDRSADAGITVAGYVRCEGRGIADAVVSDGVNVVKTDAEGYYALPSDIAKTEFVMLSTPRGYEVDAYDGFLPAFFRAVDKSAAAPQRFDFDLKKSGDNDEYVLVVVADEHVSGRVLDVPAYGGKVVAPTDSLQYEGVFLPRLKEYVASAPAGTKFYGLNLGDMTHSEYWYRNKADMDAYIRLSKDIPFSMYHCIGNHDHCHKFTDDYNAEAEYRKHFGPTYYSFNLGKVHYVVLDDMLYHGRNTYDRIIAPEQLEWLKKDLAALDPEVKELVLAAHVPLTMNAATFEGYKPLLNNWNELYAVIRGYNVHILTGDWHASATVLVDENVTEYVHPAVCGTWWYRLVCTDGSPSAFTEYRFDADGLVSRHTVPVEDIYGSCQYTVYNKGVTTNTGLKVSAKDDPQGGSPAILVNFWNYNNSWDFVCKENGREVRGRDAMVRLCDLRHRAYVDAGVVEVERYKWLRSKYVAHMFRYVPLDPSAEIEITATDYRHGGAVTVVRTRWEPEK